MRLTIGWLYPELMSTYGDRGNIICLQKRCEWRGIKAKIMELEIGTWNFKEKQNYEIRELGNYGLDLLFMGGGEDWQQKIVAADLFRKEEDGKSKADWLREIIEQGVVGLFICGAYQFLGKYYQAADGRKIRGLGIMNHYTRHPGEGKRRLIGNVIITPLFAHSLVKDGKESNKKTMRQWGSYLVGFENHGGRTYLGEGLEPLGKVIKGFGNNGEDKSEGAIYKNIIGTYLHGPILPKNPHLADWLIKKALERKYGTEVKLEKLDDALEWEAHKAVLKRF